MGSAITEFVHAALGRGIARADIVRALQQGGWSAREIERALDCFVESDLPLPVPRKRVSGSAREAFLFLMLFASLYTAAFALASVLFDLIHLALPQPGDLTHGTIVSLRHGIATTLVSFPLFLFMGRVVAREGVRNPGQRISPVRRWLTYLTLFIASVAVIADLITLVVRLLEGEVTLRFGLKVLVVATMAGAAFLYFIMNPDRDQASPPSELRLSPGARAGFAAMILVVLAALGLGFWYAGSPMEARLRAHDARRVEDLVQIGARVEQYYRNEGVLPPSLQDLDANPATYIDQKTDRVTAEPYHYRVVDATHFEVGAVFTLPGGPVDGKGAARRAQPGETSFWQHGAGRVVFTIDAARQDPVAR